MRRWMTRLLRLAARMALLPIFIPLVLFAVAATLVICVAISLEDLACGRNPFKGGHPWGP